MKKQKQQGIKKRLTKGFVKVAVIGAIAAMIGVVALLIAASQYEGIEQIWLYTGRHRKSYDGFL